MQYLYAVTLDHSPKYYDVISMKTKAGIKKYTRLFRTVDEALEYKKTIINNNNANIFEIYFNPDDPKTGFGDYFIDQNDNKIIYSTENINASRIKIK